MAWTASGYTVYTNQWGASNATTVKATGDTVETTEFREHAVGVQAENEARFAAHFPDTGGVFSGLAPTEDEPNDQIDVAAGVGYVNGLKVTGGVSITVTGAADTYYAVVDGSEANEADAYKLLTDAAYEALADENKHILLARFAWNGSDTITAFQDLRQYGTNLRHITWHSADETTALSGHSTDIVYCYRAPQAICLRRPTARVYTAGSSGTTLIDIHTGPASNTTTVWATHSNQITIANSATDKAFTRGGTLDQNYLVAAGEVVEIIFDGVAGSGAGAMVDIPYTPY